MEDNRCRCTQWQQGTYGEKTTHLLGWGYRSEKETGGSKVTAIFQPHLYTRTRDFYKEFADSLSLFDEVYLVDIYPARELPIEGITSQLIADNMKRGVCKAVISLDKVPQIVESIKDETEVLVTVGAGDLENYVPNIVEILKTKQK